MEFWSQRQHLFRIMILLGSALIFTVIGFNLVRNISSTTDENLFRNLISNVKTSKKIFVYKIDTSDTGKEVITDTLSIDKGAFIYSINGIRIDDPSEFKSVYAGLPDTLLVPLEIVTTDIVNELSLFVESHDVYIRKKDLPSDFTTFIESGVLVVYVYEDGASDRAGMLPGDIILRINDLSFRNVYEADRLLRNEIENKELKYTILRDDEIIELNVKLAQLGFNLDLVVKVIGGIIFYLFGIFLLMKKPGLVSARLFGYFFVLAGFLYFLSVNNRYYYETDTINIIVTSLATLFYSILMPVLFHALLYIPREKSDLIKKKWTYRIPYILGILFFIAIVILRFNDFIMLTDAFWSLWVTAGIIYIIVFRLIYRKRIPKEDKKMLRPLKIVLLLNIIGGIFIYIFSNLSFALNHMQPFIYVPMILQYSYPFAAFYMVGRYRLLGLDIRLRKNIQYFLFSYSIRVLLFIFFLCCVYFISDLNFDLPNLIITGTTIEVLDKPLRPELQDFYENLIVILLSIVAGLLIIKLDKKIQLYLERKFHRIRFDYRQLNRDFSEIVSNSLSVHDVTRKVVVDLSEILKIKRLGLVILKNDRVYSQEYFGFKSDSIKEFINVSSESIVESLKHFKTEFPVEYLQKPIKEVFLKCGFVYVIPITSKDTPLGMILVGEKLSESPYKQEDFELLISVAGQLSMTIENFYLLESCTVQERIKHELEIARKIQLASLPQRQPDLKDLDISGISIPALEVGGDFYDYFNGKYDNITVVIGDVSGKGTSAALYMSKIQGILRTLHEFDLSPRELLVKTNNLLYGNLDKKAFITAIGARINYRHKTMTISRAGHLPIYAYRHESGNTEKIIPRGLILGLANLEQFSNNLEEIIIDFDKDDVFLLVSDGVTEAKNKNSEEFGEERLVSLLNKNGHLSSEQIRNSIIERLKIFCGEREQHDDITIVVIKIR